MSVLNKFDPAKTLYLRGFSGLDSPAAMHSASGTGFTLSGKFSKPAAFWDLVLFDIDDFYGHPRIKPLPDPDLTGIVLEFDVSFSGAVGFDCPKYPTIDWPFLDYVTMAGAVGRIDLSVGNLQSSLGLSATPNPNPTTITSGTHTAASVTIAVNVGGSIAGDLLTLWFQNFSYSYTMLGGDNPNFVAAQIAAGINAYSYAGQTYGLHATSSGANITITASRGGVDGNMIRLYWTSTDATRESITTANPIQLTGGSSAVTYHVKLDFSALGLTSVRQLVMTFAPLLADSADYTPALVDIVFSSWAITADPGGKGPLFVAGPGSVRVEESDAWVTLKGNWTRTNVGWFSQGYAVVSATPGDTVTITYWCPHVHDVWVGTFLGSGGGTFSSTLDGTAVASIDTNLTTTETISTRRKIASGIGAGQHTVVLTISVGNGYFDFIEACVSSDVPAAPGPWLDRKPANDFDTQHGYQLAPARIMWMFDALGFTGSATPYYLYSGVFWLNQRAASGRTLASFAINFSTLPTLTPYTAAIFIDVGGTTIGKSVRPNEGAAIWALHFALFINETFSGVRASVSGSVLTLYTRDDTAAYAISSISAYYNNGAGNVTFATGSLTGSVPGTWLVDPTQTPALNYAAAQWHADFFAQASARSTQVACALSMEVVYPPDANVVGQVWAQRFENGTVVTTDTGFSNISSTQCAPMASSFLAYQVAQFSHLAALQAAAGLTPYLVLGEFLWWFFSSLWLRPIGYVAILSYVRLGFSAAHGLIVGDRIRVADLQGISSINGTWSVLAVPDANHVDIDAPYTGGTWVTGTGVASGGSMAFYDAETEAAASAALSRSLAYFAFPDDTPTLPDALFLANRLAAHVATIIAAVPSATWGLLLPLDVNGPTVTPVSKVGGQLNAYVNVPAAWTAQSTAPFSKLWIEALAFSTTDRNIDFMKTTLARVASWAWPSANTVVLYSVDNPGVQQWSDYDLAKRYGYPALTPFAFDQVNLIGWRLGPPKKGGAQVL